MSGDPIQAADARRACVQGEERSRRPGTIAWAEHEEAWEGYRRRFGNGQTAQRIHDRGGFGYAELVTLLGHEPTTWQENPR